MTITMEGARKRTTLKGENHDMNGLYDVATSLGLTIFIRINTREVAGGSAGYLTLVYSKISSLLNNLHTNLSISEVHFVFFCFQSFDKTITSLGHDCFNRLEEYFGTDGIQCKIEVCWLARWVA